MTKNELKVFSEIGITAGQVTFGALFVGVFQVDENKFLVLLSSLLLTFFFWLGSWFLTKKYRL